MKKYSLIILFSFFFLINNVHAEYYLTPNRFTMSKTNTTLQFDYYGENSGDLSSVYTLDGNTDTWFRFEFDLDGSNCGSNIDSAECFNTIHAIEDGGVSNTIYGSFQMCVSKPQFHWAIDWSSCTDNCLKKSQDLVIINNSYQNCTLGLYNIETGSNMTNDGYLVNVYYDIAKWQYIEGAFSGVVNGRLYLYNDSESTLYYRFVDNVLLSDRNMASWDSGFGIFNHDYSQPDVGGETFLNNGTCFMSYNRMNNYNISTWDRENETLTFNNTLPKQRNFDNKNLWDNDNFSYNNVNGISRTDTGFIFNRSNAGGRWVSNRIQVQKGKTYTFSYIGSGVPPTDLLLYVYRGSVYGEIVKFTHSNVLTFIAPENEELFFTIIMNSGLQSAEINDIQVEINTKRTNYSPYYGYTISYDNMGGSFDIFRWYDTNLRSNGIIQYKLTSYSGKTKVADLVNCPNTKVCRYENELYFAGSFTSLFNSDEQRIKKIEFQLLSSTMSIYFKNPYIYNLEDVPGRATWQSYYQPANVYICSDNDNGTYYNALSKKVYFNPDKPPESFISNTNSDYQNIFGQSINFYGLTDILNFPIQIITKINNGDYRNCTPLQIPFPGFPNKTLTLPCFSTFLWDKFPTLRDVYNIIIIGVLSLKVGLGTINYIKKWYLGTIEGEDI